MSHPISVSEAWIYSALAADSALAAIVGTRIYADQAQEGAAYPLVIYSCQGGSDTQYAGTRRVLSRPLFQIVAVSDGPTDANTRIVEERIDEVIGKATHQLSNGYYFTGRRVSPVSITQPKGNSSQFYKKVGGIYRLEVSKAS